MHNTKPLRMKNRSTASELWGEGYDRMPENADLLLGKMPAHHGDGGHAAQTVQHMIALFFRVEGICGVSIDATPVLTRGGKDPQKETLLWLTNWTRRAEMAHRRVQFYQDVSDRDALARLTLSSAASASFSARRPSVRVGLIAAPCSIAAMKLAISLA